MKPVPHDRCCNKMPVVACSLCTDFAFIWRAAIFIFHVFYRISSGCWNGFSSLQPWQLQSLELNYRLFCCERPKGCALHCFWAKDNTVLSTGLFHCRHEGPRKIKPPKLLHIRILFQNLPPVTSGFGKQEAEQQCELHSSAGRVAQFLCSSSSIRISEKTNLTQGLSSGKEP